VPHFYFKAKIALKAVGHIFVVNMVRTDHFQFSVFVLDGKTTQKAGNHKREKVRVLRREIYRACFKMMLKGEHALAITKTAVFGFNTAETYTCSEKCVSGLLHAVNA